MTDSIYRVIELIGSSPDGWEQATANAVKEAQDQLETSLRVAEVIEMDVVIEDGNIRAYRSKVRLSYKTGGAVGIT